MNRHPLHSLCPYFATFPESFVAKQLGHLKKSGVVFDPFCGRGTTLFEATLHGFPAAGTDTNPVAVCISNAKLNPPALADVLHRLERLEQSWKASDTRYRAAEFFRLCYNPMTLRQLQFLRQRLHWRTNEIDCFISAMALWSLHGESHRSPNYFSNRMPRTISTKPQYSIKWWRVHKCTAPLRDVFAILRRMAHYRLRMPVPEVRGRVAELDAREAYKAFPSLAGTICAVITSPPYLDTTDYHEDQWLRLWFLGGLEKPSNSQSDDRHTNSEQYWEFLADAWAGVAPLLASSAIVAIRIGGKYLRLESVRKRLEFSLSQGLQRRVKSVGGGSISIFEGGQRVSFHSNAGRGVSREFDFKFLV